MTNVARLNPNGTVDLTFNPGTAANLGSVSAIACQPNGKVLIGGAFASTTAAAPANLARLNTNGTPDNGFDLNLNIDNSVNAVLVQPDGKILFGGAFEYVDGFRRQSAARLYTNGTLDTGFDACVASSSGAGATALAWLSDEKILMSGKFVFSTGNYRDGIARLNPNGDLDAIYAPPPGVDLGAVAYALTCRSDGRALLGGNFSYFYGLSSSGLVQLTTNGIPDAGFVVGTGLNSGGTNFSMALQSDGKLIVAGDFTTYNSTNRYRVARIKSGGSLDPLFDPGTGPNDAISASAVQSDGKILVVGRFSSFNGAPRNGVARLKGDPYAKLDPPTLSSNGHRQLLFHGDDQIPYAIQASSNLVSWVTITNFTCGSNAVTITDPTVPPLPVRFYRSVYPP